MGSVLGSIFGFGNKMKRRLRDAISNPSDYANSIDEHWADPNVINYHRTPNGWDLELK